MRTVERLNWAEQLIQNGAEPGLEYVHLGRRHRDVLGPIIGDSPGGQVVLGRLARKGPRRAKPSNWQSCSDAEV